MSSYDMKVLGDVERLVARPSRDTTFLDRQMTTGILKRVVMNNGDDSTRIPMGVCGAEERGTLSRRNWKGGIFHLWVVIVDSHGGVWTLCTFLVLLVGVEPF